VFPPIRHKQMPRNGKAGHSSPIQSVDVARLRRKAKALCEIYSEIYSFRVLQVIYPRKSAKGERKSYVLVHNHMSIYCIVFRLLFSQVMFHIPCRIC